MFTVNQGDVDEAKKRYLATWVHYKCGGAPQAESGMIMCSVCKARWVWLGTIEYTLQQISDWKRLTI